MTDAEGQIPEEKVEPDTTGTLEVAEEGTTNDGDTFPRSYVEELRRENAKYRDKASKHAQALHQALVSATGRLADPSDLPFSEEHLTDPAALEAAITGLLDEKPHLASRRPRGDVGQGVLTEQTNPSLGALLRARA
jgi:hypothetical protein